MRMTTSGVAISRACIPPSAQKTGLGPGILRLVICSTKQVVAVPRDWAGRTSLDGTCTRSRRCRSSPPDWETVPPSGRGMRTFLPPSCSHRRKCRAGLRVAEVATAVLIYLYTEAARRQVIVEVAVADYGQIASRCGHFFGVEFLGQAVALGAVAEIDAHHQRLVLLGLLDSCRSSRYRDKCLKRQDSPQQPAICCFGHSRARGQPPKRHAKRHRPE